SIRSKDRQRRRCAEPTSTRRLALALERLEARLLTRGHPGQRMRARQLQYRFAYASAPPGFEVRTLERRAWPRPGRFASSRLRFKAGPRRGREAFLQLDAEDAAAGGRVLGTDPAGDALSVVDDLDRLVDLERT